MTPRSCLRWKPTGKIFKTVGLKWIPTGKIFTSSTTKVDSEPTNGSNDDITNQYECKQTLDVSAGTLNIHAGTSLNPTKEGLRVSYALSWKPCQGDSLNLPNHSGDGDASFQLKSDSLPPKSSSGKIVASFKLDARLAVARHKIDGWQKMIKKARKIFNISNIKTNSEDNDQGSDQDHKA
ncbi:hypothetical protein Tco_1304716 [Tanacetum coccineum]